MSYTPHNFTDGSTLYAQQLNQMDAQIAKLSEEYEPIRSFELENPEEVSVFEINRDEHGQPFSLKKLYAHLYLPATETTRFVQFQSLVYYGNMGFAYTNANAGTYCNLYIELDSGFIVKSYSCYGTESNGSNAMYSPCRLLLPNELSISTLRILNGIYDGVTIDVYGVRM